MSNWLFLMLLYGFFGWMKKRQRDKARDKIESQDDWDTGGIAVSYTHLTLPTKA